MKKRLQTQFSTRQYMLSRDFEIYYYSDTAPIKVTTHAHDYYEFYFFLEGNVSIQIENEQLPLTCGDVILIPPNVRHRAVIHNLTIPYRRFVFWIMFFLSSYALCLIPQFLCFSSLMPHFAAHITGYP